MDSKCDLPIIRMLVDDNSILRAKHAFDTVFESANPSRHPFQESIRARAILFPSNYFFNDKQYGAIVSVASGLGDSTCYFSNIEGYNGTGDSYKFNYKRLHAQILDLEQPRDIVLRELEGDELMPPVESALYSENGEWGAISSQEIHTTVGGSELFLSLLGQHINLDGNLAAFLDYWESHQHYSSFSTEWIPAFLTHIYGEKFAEEVVRNRSFLQFDG